MLNINCHHCLSKNYVKNGSYKGVQRYLCKTCKRSFTSNGLRTPIEKKKQALEMYLNSVGIRKIARFLKVSPSTILYWIKKTKILKPQEKQYKRKFRENDCIEMDEIYTFVQKKTKEQ